MVVSFVLDWSSFFAGAVATVLVGFFVLVGIAARQYKNQQKGRKRL